MTSTPNPAPVAGPRPTLKDRIGQIGKALAGALSGALVSVLFTTVTDPDAAVNPDAVDTASNPLVQLPNTTAEWVTLAIAVLIGFALPYLKRNFPSQAQALQQYQNAQRRVVEGKQSV